MDESIEAYIKNLNTSIDQLIAEIPDTSPIGCLVSGGIDSSIIAKLLMKINTDAEFLSFGSKGSLDLPFIKILEINLNKKIQYFEFSEEEIVNTVNIVKKILRDKKIIVNITQVSLGVGYFCILKKAKELGITDIFTGQGPDILFAGYNMFKKTEISKLNDLIKTSLPLLEVDKMRDQAIANYFGIKLCNPYLTHEFIDFSLSIPSNLKLHSQSGVIIEKYISRKVGETIGLPQEIYNRPKKAFQYSTRFQKIISR